MKTRTLLLRVAYGRGVCISKNTSGVGFRVISFKKFAFIFITAFLIAGSAKAVGEPNNNCNCTPQSDVQLSGDSVGKLINSDEIMKGFNKGQERVRVIVNLTEPVETKVKTNWNSKHSLKLLRNEIKNAQTPVLSGLSEKEFKLRYCFDNQAGFSGEVTLDGLERLKKDSRVISIEPVYTLQPHLRQGISLMYADTYRSIYNGSGIAIAICDTGIDYTHPMLGNGGFPNSKVIGGYDYGDNDADPMPASTQAHGTSCAGIAAGDLGNTGDYIGGVADNAKLYALKITAGSTSTATNDAMIAAWDWCVTHKNDDPNHPILAISTSFGGGRSYNSCDSLNLSMTQAANNAVAAGITVIASSGNDGYCDSISWPACISNVISVGAVYDASFGIYSSCVNSQSCATKYSSTGCSTGYYASDSTAADMVTSYSNTASFLTIFAPSNKCYTTDIVGSGGYSSGDYYSSFGGTSAACPYVAGAVACLQSAAKVIRGSYLSPSEVKTILTSTGNNITDGKVAITKPRVNLAAAIDSIAPPGQATNPNPATSATGVSITPTLSWIAGSGTVSHDVYFGTTSPGTLVSTQSDTSYTPGTISVNTIYYWRIDEKNTYGTTTGNVWSFTTLIDTSPPTPNPMTWVTAPTATGSTSITMTAATAADNATPPVMYYFECTTDGDKSSVWQTNTTYVVSGLTPGTLYSFRVKARDSVPVPNETGWSTTQSVTTPLFSDGFESGNFTAGGWAVTGNAGVSTSAQNTGTYGARLPATKNSTSSIQKNLSTVGYTTIHILYDRKNTNTSQTLFVEWSIDGATWYNLETTTSTTYASQSWTCAASADNNAGFRVRFRTTSTSNTSGRYAYIDNVQITGTPIPPPPQHTLTVTTVGNGTVTTPGIGLFSYNYGTVVNLAAVATTGYHFVEWSGSGVIAGKVANPNSASTTITMDDDYTVVANFAINQFTITASAGENGTIEPVGEVTKDYGSSQLFTATANTGYEVDKWTLDGSDIQTGGDTYTLSDITAAHTVGVSFKILTYTISGTVTAGGTGLDSVTMSGLPGNPVTNGGGLYTATVDYGWSGTVTPTKEGYSFAPESIVYTNVAENKLAESYTAALNMYAISGFVVEPDGNTPVEGVAVSASGSGSGITDVNGYYEVLVPYGWSGTVGLTKEGYTFEPNGTAYDNIVADEIGDYTATLSRFVISGYVLELDGIIPISDVNVSAENGGGSYTSRYGDGADTTDANGYYEVVVDYNWTGRVTPVKYAYGFEPNSLSYANVLADQTERGYTGKLLTFIISGHIRNQCDVPIKNVTVTTTSGGNSTVTDANGYYEVWVDYNWSGAITPAKNWYIASPTETVYANVLADQTGQDYQAVNKYDLDCDTNIDYDDLYVISFNWLYTGENICDFNLDNNVNLVDFVDFATVWLEE